MIKTAFLAALLAVVAASPALAASHARDSFIADFDANKDGYVSRDEFAAVRAERFSKTDSNKDGVLQQEEYVGEFKVRLAAGLPLEKAPDASMFTRQMEQAIVRFDILSDGDGGISKPEYDYSGWSMFRHHDTSGDGRVGKDDEPAKDGN